MTTQLERIIGDASRWPGGMSPEGLPLLNPDNVQAMADRAATLHCSRCGMSYARAAHFEQWECLTEENFAPDGYPEPSGEDHTFVSTPIGTALLPS